MRTLFVVVCFLGWTAAPFHAQQDAPPKAPIDVKPGSITYDDGPYFSVNWTNSATLESAIWNGPVKIGVAADQLETAWHSTGGHSGWFGVGFHPELSGSFWKCT